MRSGTGTLALVAACAVGFTTSLARAGGPPCATCAHAGAAHTLGLGHTAPVWEDESPLYPQLAWWTFQHTQCKQPHPCKGGSLHDLKRTGEVVSFPPLPYSPLLRGYHGPHGAVAAPAPAPAPAPPESPANAGTAPAGAPVEGNPPAASPGGASSPAREVPAPRSATPSAPAPPIFDPFE
ncbi:MAG: hypothetical protein AB7I30_14650 [Isosphaeraceae bacterium]